MSFRRTIQLFCLALFLFLLSAAVFSILSQWPLDFFLTLDPSLVFLTSVSGRMIFSAMVPSAIVLLLSPLMGRVFCGYICPMGTTLDFGEKISGFKKKAGPKWGQLLSLKYLLLAFIFGAALLGVSLVFLAAPLSLITRFYGLLIHSILAQLMDMGLNLLRPLADKWDMTSISLAQIKPPRFSTQYFILVFFGGLFILSGL